MPRRFSVSHRHEADREIVLLAACEDRVILESTLAETSDQIVARHAPFELVQPLISSVLSLRPEVVTFDYLCTDTADLARLVRALGYRVEVDRLPDIDTVVSSETDRRWLGALLTGLTADERVAVEGYGAYALAQRDHRLLTEMTTPVLHFFDDAERILDVGCGTGIFLEQMARCGKHAVGIDSDPASLAYAAMLGLNIEKSDGVEWLKCTDQRFDAVYCSHVVEHLPFDQLKMAISGIVHVLQPGGKAVFVFPDPESIRSQLLGFWRDPDHVRFYHPDVITLLAQADGLALEHNSQQTPPRDIISFSYTPPEFERPAVTAGLLGRFMHKIGLVRRDEFEWLKARSRWQDQLLQTLWSVNQTWAWDDNAVLVFRKPAR